MKTAIFAIAAVALFAAGSASASDRITDAQFLKAARCAGLAKAVPGVLDGQALDAFYKQASVQRGPAVMDRADAESDRARREAKGSGKERATAELSGFCAALLSDPSSVARK
jgi:hypothetical protein